MKRTDAEDLLKKLSIITLEDIKQMRDNGDDRDVFALTKVTGYEYFRDVLGAVMFFVKDE